MLEKKFSFGENWRQYVLKSLDESKLETAKKSLLRFLPESEYSGKTFIDIGCGSGIFSLGACLLGCKKIISCDTDPESVQATHLVHERFMGTVPPDTSWEIFRGDILDNALIEKLKAQGDIVYSWGVLHHTGNIWQAIRNAAALVKPDGYFIIAIYNKAPSSAYWVRVKRFYNRVPKFVQILLASAMFFYQFLRRYSPNIKAAICKKQKPYPLLLTRERGMSIYYDVVDWLGGYPYEFATSDEIIRYIEPLGFKIIFTPTKITHGKIKFRHRFTTYCTGNNEFVFQKMK